MSWPSKQHAMKDKFRGMTLIEVMVVIAIVGILVSIAYPRLGDYLRKTRRTDAHAALQAAMLAQEKHRINNITYADTAAMLDPASNPAFARVCVVSAGRCLSQEGHYEIQATNATGGTYRLTATALGAQAGDTACPTIWVEQTTTQLRYGAGTTSPSPCWTR